MVRTNTPTDFAPCSQPGLGVSWANGLWSLLNDDTELDSGFLQALHEAYDGPGIYQPRILGPTEPWTTPVIGYFIDGFNIARDRGTTRARTADYCGAFSGAAVMFSPEVLSSRCVRWRLRRLR